MSPMCSIWVEFLLLALVFPLLSEQTPTTHVMTKTITAGEFAATAFPSEGASTATDTILGITLSVPSMAPSSKVTVTAIVTYDVPSGGPFLGTGFATYLILFILPFWCLMVYQLGFMSWLFKETVTYPKPTEQPIAPTPQLPDPNALTDEERELSEEEKHEEAARLERERQEWEAMVAGDDEMKQWENIVYTPPTSNPKKKVAFAVPGSYDVRPNDNHSNIKTKGSRVTVNIK